MKKDSKRIKKGILCLCIVPATLLAGEEESYEFDWNAVAQELGVEINAESYARVHRQLQTGRRPYDIYEGNRFLSHERVSVDYSSENQTMVVSIPVEVLRKLSLKKPYEDAVAALESGSEISDLSAVLPGASIGFDEVAQCIRLSVPQAYKEGQRREIANEAIWNYGIPAVRLRYDIDAARNHYSDRTDNRGFLSYEGQVNLGEWRGYLRGNLRRQTGRHTESDIWDKYLSKPLPSLKAKVRVGEFSSISRYLPGIPILGVNFYEDTDQLEEIDRAYLPVVSGFALSPALVTVKQGGRVIRQREVPAGPFEFDDLLEVRAGGNIDLEIREKNGKVSTFVIPYAGGNDRLLKPGRLTWSASLGRYWDGISDDHPWLTQGDIGYGWKNGLTFYGGATVSEDYQRYLLGTAFDIGTFGTCSVQYEDTHVERYRQARGHTLEFSWYRYFDDSNASIEATYRKTIDGAPIAPAAMLEKGNDWYRESYAENDFIEDEFSLSLSRAVAEWGTLSGSCYYTRTKKGEENRSLTASFYFPIGKANAEVRAQNSMTTWNGGREEDWQVALAISIPLDSLWGQSYGRYSNLRLTRTEQKNGDWGNRVDFSSTFGERSDWQINTYLLNSETDDAYNVGLYHEAGMADWSVSAGRSNQIDTYTMRVSGGLLATEYGLTLSRQVDPGSVALVNVPHVEKARLLSAGRDSLGEWQVSHPLREYRRNSLRLDPQSIPPNVHLMRGYEQELIPANSAVIPVIFETYQGYQAVFKLTDEKGAPLPYCTLVKVKDSAFIEETALIDDLGRAYFSAVPQDGSLVAEWATDDGIARCEATYILKEETKTNGIHQENLICRQVGQQQMQGK